MRVIDLKVHQKVVNFVPMQLGPIAIASDPARDRVLVLNYLSSSLTVASGKLFAPSAKFPAAQLAAYRQGRGERLQRPARTLPGVPEGLPCEHLLVANPDTSAETKLYLGAVSIRRPRTGARTATRAYTRSATCRRRYVKSFPAVGHWLSLVPVLPFLDLLVELFCCWVMPDTFGRYAAADLRRGALAGAAVPVPARPCAEGADTLQAFEALGTVTGLFGKFLQFGKVATDT